MNDVPFNLNASTLDELSAAIQVLSEGFKLLPATDSHTGDLLPVLKGVAERMHENYPYHHPLYLGQMLKPPHPVAAAAYALAMCINPNNHAHDGGIASSQLEKECIAQLGEMIGWQQPMGHLCSGGTMANCEALWVARELTTGGVAASSMAHYTHERLCGVLQIPFRSVPVDDHGRMDIQQLERIIADGDIGTVVVTLGTTGLGAVDPLPEVLALRDQYGLRVHVDAAYGGYFKLVEDLAPETRAAFDVMHEADSIVIDPHKHGLQPYGCGAVLFRDHEVARVYKHDSPYTYFTSDDLHLGEISLECSRPGAAAVALWATMQHLPLSMNGAFSQQLSKSRLAAMQLHQWLENSSQFTPVLQPELDIVVWLARSPQASTSSELARKFFDAAAQQDLHLALLKLDRSFLERSGMEMDWDQEQVTCLRACLMKPEHLSWMPRIIERLEQIAVDCL